jgi:hypothetical protein
MNPEMEEMRLKVEALGERIARRERELREGFASSEVRDAYLSRIKALHSRLAGGLAEVPRLQWLGMRDALDRDYNSLVDELGRAIEDLDTAQYRAADPTDPANRH